MAASKDTRRSAPDTNPFFLKLFRNSSASKERERIWHDAAQHAGAGDPRLRFPVYEHLYLLNVYTQKMVELLEDLSRKFAINSESLPYYQSKLRYVQTEAWLHQSQPRVKEEKLRDPDDVYITVRQCEAERRRQKPPPRIQFLNETQAIKIPTSKCKTGKAN